MHVREQIRARVTSTSSGTSRSSSTSMRPLHLLSFGAKGGAPYLPYVLVCMGYYEKVANQGRRYPQLAESRHADAEKI